MKIEYYYASQMGEVYKLTKTKWKKFLKDFLKGKNPILDNYGRPITGHVESVTDLSEEHAEWLLKEANEGR